MERFKITELEKLNLGHCDPYSDLFIIPSIDKGLEINGGGYVYLTTKEAQEVLGNLANKGENNVI